MRYNQKDIYCYEGTDVLVNKYGIKDFNKLKEVELDLTQLRIAQLELIPQLGEFDVNHLYSIHKAIFQDVYDWAGKPRTTSLSLQNVMFAQPQYIERSLSLLLSELNGEDFLVGLSKEDLACRLAYYKSEINVVHPFRDGNGRAIREFTRCLALNNGYVLSFKEKDKDIYLEAMIHSPISVEKLEKYFINNIYKLV